MKAINLPGILQALYATNHAHLGCNTYVICLDNILWFERNAPITISNQAIAVIIQWFQRFSVIIQWCSFAVQELAPTLLQKLQRGDQDENGEHGTEFFFSRLLIFCDSKSCPKQMEIVLRVDYWTLFWIYISSERCANCKRGWLRFFGSLRHTLNIWIHSDFVFNETCVCKTQVCLWCVYNPKNKHDFCTSFKMIIAFCCLCSVVDIARWWK